MCGIHVMTVCMYVCMYVLCICVREKEREREMCVCVCVYVRSLDKMKLHCNIEHIELVAIQNLQNIGLRFTLKCKTVSTLRDVCLSGFRNLEMSVCLDFET
jgi:hypothetical protein